MLEKEIERYLRDKIKAAGGLCLKWICPGFTGVPDRIILLPGGLVRFAELKAPGKTERPRQRLVQNILRRMGFTVYARVDSREKAQAVVKDCLEAMARANI